MFRYGRTDKISQGWFSTSHFFMSNNLVGTTHHLNTRHLNTHLVKGHYSDDSMILMSVIQIPTVLSKNLTVTPKLGSPCICCCCKNCALFVGPSTPHSN